VRSLLQSQAEGLHVNAIVCTKNTGAWTNVFRLFRPGIALFVPAYSRVNFSLRSIPIEQALNEVLEFTVIDRFCDVGIATSREGLGVKVHRVVR